MPAVDISAAVARVFMPLEKPARYKGAWGGRGSGKSHDAAGRLVRKAVQKFVENGEGLRWVCIREVQKTLAQSSKYLLEQKISSLGVAELFEVQREKILTPGGGQIIFEGMQDHTAESTKSLEAMGGAWVEEAQTLSARSLTLLRPTIRQEGSEIWFTWNPRRPTDAVDEFMRGDNPPEDSIIVQANWSENPWLTKALNDERLHDLNAYPERYAHIWEGGFATAFEGAYFAKHLEEARQERRIIRLVPDEMVPFRCYWDIGGAGARADATAIWIVQFIDREIRVLDYIEGQGQTLSYYVHELRGRGYGQALCFLPHDGVNTNAVTGKRYMDHISDAGFEVEAIPNQGSGAAKMRVEAVRRMFPRILFDDEKTAHGRDALGFYHEKRSEDRNIGLGPEHDWSSHAADAFGLMCIHYEEPSLKENKGERYRPAAGRAGGWMG